MKDLFFVLDQGTTEHKAVVYDRSGRAVAWLSAMAPESRPHPDGFGGDPTALAAVSDDLVARVFDSYGERLFACGLANQGETVVAWDARTGEALSRAVSWQCREARPEIENKKDRFGAIRNLTGLVPDPYFSAAKLERLMRVNARVRRAAEQGRLALGTLDSWMIWRWTLGRHFVTDPTTACRTQLFDISKLDWSDFLVDTFGLKREFLPRVVNNSLWEIPCEAGPFARHPLPLMASLCDQPAALIGHGGLEHARLKASFGTGAFVNGVTDTPEVAEGLLTSVLWTAEKAPPVYYREGGVLSFVSTLHWMEGEFGVTRDVVLSELNASSDLHCLPALAGLGAPHFRPAFRTAFSGDAARFVPRDRARALVRGLVFRVVEILELMRAHGELVSTLYADGGASRSPELMGFLADAAGLEVAVRDDAQITSAGVAAAVAARCGFDWRADGVSPVVGRYRPADGSARRDYLRWKEWVDGTLARGEA